MSDPDVDAAIRSYPELKSLQRLLSVGQWSGAWRTTNGGTQLLVFMRGWQDGSTDLLMIYDIANVRSERHTPLGESVWERTGALDEVANELYDLPAPGTPQAPTLVIGRALSLRDL